MKGNILLIEDDEILVKDFVKNMRDFNPDLKIHHAEEKEQATKILLDYKIDIVLLDLVLNSWNGFEYFTIINELKIPQPPTIVISSVKITHVIVKAMKHGAIDFINKPFDYAEVKGKIERIILTTRKKGSKYKLHSINRRRYRHRKRIACKIYSQQFQQKRRSDDIYKLRRNIKRII